MDKHESSIKIENMTFSYGGGRPNALEDISFSVSAGESVALIGANGAGKSTLLRLLIGLNDGYSGNIELCGIPVTKENYVHLRQHVGYVFQDADSQLFMSTVRDDIAFAPKNYGYSKEETAVRTERAMEMVGISHLAGRQIYTLSGGEKKLASIATILSMTPDVILLDEPTIALDPKNRRRLIGVLNSLPQLKIIATHDLDMVLDTCPRTIIISDGKIAYDGPSEQAINNSVLLEKCGL